MSLSDRLQRRTAATRQTLAAALLLVGTTVTVGSALLLQHVGGYIPCALCLEQRTPYYLAIPVALVALLGSIAGVRPASTRILLVIVAILMAWAMGLGVYHAGVEWRWWAGPADCAAAAPVDLTGDLLSTLDSVHPPSCTDAALRVFGLSLAGWNAVAATILLLIALRGAFARPSRFG
ncbi:disulfide bond formation protein B [Aureimonas sp. AU4]|uniref:disulfide bond formation protein B n=1 Tax=Aureimonas sp. AU4 TaxID=1638163 RepID=UPI00070619AA|nr:disulfide bond formation protein B [Aureimonas sp. AU4]BAT30453.1 hypothetical protein [Aureimonas sp. AU4]